MWLVDQLLMLLCFDLFNNLQDVVEILLEELLQFVVMDIYYLVQQVNIDVCLQFNVYDVICIGQLLFLSLLVCNLLDNVICYSLQGSVVDVILYVCSFIVRDNGFGVVLEILMYIGECFYCLSG